jgi:hypothetical protein
LLTAAFLSGLIGTTRVIVAAVEPGMHAVAVELDFVQPLVAFPRRVDQLGELRRDPFRQSRPA